MLTVLVDGDIVSYRCSASVNKQVKEILSAFNVAIEPHEFGIKAMEIAIEGIERLNVEKEVAILRADKLMRDIIRETEATHHRVFLTGSNNFRKELYPEYKAHRVQEKPLFLADVNQFLIDEWGAEVVHDMEADDMLGITQMDSINASILLNEKLNTIIASIDKDLDMIPGEHYNFVKKERYSITEFQGYYNFYKSILVGDRTDNIPGYKLGYGPKAAENELMACSTEQELYETVRSLYNDDERLLLNAQLLWIKRAYSPSLGNTSLQGLLNNLHGTNN